jgi:hypothetical protein
VFRLSPPQPAIQMAVREPKSHGVHFMLSPLMFAGTARRPHPTHPNGEPSCTGRNRT